MKKLAATFALLLLSTFLPVQAQSSATKKGIRPLLRALEDAYTAKALGKLDAARPYFGRVKIVIEHSLSEDSFETRVFSNLAKGEQWLRSREREDNTPFREARELLQCKNGLCTYNLDGGISHNHLYLQKISYAYRNGRPLIKTIYLLDGD